MLEVSRFCSSEMAASLTTPLSPKFSVSNGRKPSNKIQRALTAFHQKGNECTRTPILRREILKGLAVIPATLIINKEPPYSEAREVEVGSYLPPSPTDPSFVFFKASPKDTPALRAVSCRKCAALPICSPTKLETDASSKHIIRELLPAEVCRALGGGEV